MTTSPIFGNLPALPPLGKPPAKNAGVTSPAPDHDSTAPGGPCTAPAAPTLELDAGGATAKSESGKDRVKSTVRLDPARRAWLAHLAIDLSAQLRIRIGYSDLIEAFVRAIEESGIDLSDVTSTEQIVERIKERLAA